MPGRLRMLRAGLVSIVLFSCMTAAPLTALAQSEPSSQTIVTTIAPDQSADVLAFSSRELYDALDSPTVHTVTLGAKVLLDPSDWAETVTINRSIVLAGGASGDPPHVLDFNGMVAAIHLGPAAQLNLSSVTVQGVAPEQAVDPALGLSQTFGDTLWPSITSTGNASWVSSNTLFIVHAPPGTTCQEWNEGLSEAFTAAGATFSQSADGETVTVSRHVFNQPVINMTTRATLGSVRLIADNASQTCRQPLPPAPAPGPAQILSLGPRADDIIATAAGVPWQQGNPAVALTAQDLQRFLNDSAVSAITQAADIQLSPGSWTGTSVINRSIAITGSRPGRRFVLDLGGMLDAISVQPYAVLLLKDLVLRGSPPHQALDSALVAPLPQHIGSVLWPALVTLANSTVVYNNTDTVFFQPLSGATCQQYNAQALESLDRQNINYQASTNGLEVSLAGATFEQPVVSRATNTFLGLATIKTTNASGTCVEFMGQTSEASAVAEAQSSGGLSGGGVAGVVAGVVVAAAAIAVLIAFLLWRRGQVRRLRLKAKSSCDISKDLVGSMAPTASNLGPQDVQDYFSSVRFSEDPVQRFMASKASFELSSSTPQRECSSRASMQFEWRVEPSRLTICRHPDGRPFKLGAGGFGTVYKAVMDDVREVAVKFLRADGEEGGARSMRQFAMEVDIMRACRDPHIVAFLGAWLDPTEGVSYLVQEYVEEGDLASALASDQRAPTYMWHNRGRCIALDISRALHYLHSNGIIHFDVKSANCLLDKPAKLTDVGLSHALASQSHLSGAAMRGTWAYASPEACAGTACTFKSDIWSFGVLLWEIITGERPQRGRYRMFRPGECPQEIADLVDACMRNGPDERPTAKEVVRILLPHGRP